MYFLFHVLRLFLVIVRTMSDAALSSGGRDAGQVVPGGPTPSGKSTLDRLFDDDTLLKRGPPRIGHFSALSLALRLFAAREEYLRDT